MNPQDKKEETEVHGVLYSDYDGNELLWSKSTTTKEQAVHLFDVWLKANNREADLGTTHSIQKWYCRDCNFYTSGEPMCCECGKDFKSKGRSIYQLFLH